MPAPTSLTTAIREPAETTIIAVTLIATAINPDDGETNPIEGRSHFAFFAKVIVLAFPGLSTAAQLRMAVSPSNKALLIASGLLFGSIYTT